MITFDNTEFDLGTIQYGENVSVSSEITNSGSISVQLVPANSSCSCTTGSIDYSTMQPNTKAKFTITLNTKKSGRGSNLAKSIALTYIIDRKTFSQIFRIKANVV